jgi:nucleoside phosphorylase
VAWIAPLEIEAQAAWYMLDHEHKGNFTISRGDDYVYTAGDINGHNVIIATFPSGQDYGVGSAAALASQVKKSFPNLWFGLLVGVAAGLPNLSRVPPRDIRLGDVLVGVGEGDDAGLVSYGLGKETSDGFQLLRHGVQAKTETVVRSVIGSIKALAPMHGNVFLQYYESIKDKKHSNGTFADPGQERDQLYQIVDDENGPVTKLVERPLRHPSERTKVWYGPIGSGDKLMKNAKKRDELRDKFNLIGLEMEAAGTTNTIPVSVIRGVCDYGDTQKNKEWQPYAAAMAAAYAKAVLYKIRPSKPGFGRGYQPPNLASSPNPFGGNAGTPTYPFPQNLFSPEPGVGALGYFRPARYEASHGAPRYSDVMTPYGQAPGYGYPGYGLPQPGPRSQFYAQFGQQPENVTELQKALEDTRRERNRREIGEKRFAATMEEEKKRREAEEKKLAALERLLEDTKHDAARCKKIVEERETEERKLAAMIEEEKKKREAEEKKLADLERLLGDTKHEAERYKKIVEERETEERKLATMMEEERKKREAEEKKLVTLEWFLEDATKER